MKGRRWSSAALLGGLLLLAATTRTWGASILLCPLNLASSAVAWFWSDRDGIFWLGATLNVLLVVGAVTILYEGK